MGASCRSGSGGCSSPPAPARAWRPSTTCRSAARCSRSRCCSAALALPLVLPALLTSVIATAVAWISARNRPDLRRPELRGPRLADRVGRDRRAAHRVCSASAWVRLIASPTRDAPRRAGPLRWRRSAAFSALGGALDPVPAAARQRQGRRAAGVRRRQLSLGLLAVLLVLKPLVTAACLGSGAPGGLFTPTLAIGVLFAGVLGDRVDARLARRAGRQLRADRRRRVPRGGDAGAARRRPCCARADHGTSTR